MTDNNNPGGGDNNPGNGGGNNNPAGGNTPGVKVDHESEKSLLRAEAAANRVEARKEKDRADTLEKDLQKAKTEADTKVAEVEGTYKTKAQKLQDKIVNSEIKAAAAAAGLVDMDLLPLIKRDGVKIDDDDNVTGIEEAIKAFKESKPNFFKDDSAGGGKGDDKNDKNKGGKGDDKDDKTKTGGKNPPPAKNLDATNVKDLDKSKYADAKRDAMKKLRNAG